MTDINAIWSSIKAELQLSVSLAHFNTWISPLSATSWEVGEGISTLELGCPSTFVRAMILDKYKGQIIEAAERISGKEVKLSVIIGEKAVNTKDIPVSESPLFSQEPQSQIQGTQHNLNPRLTMETYVVGSSNNFAHAAAMGVIKNPGRKYNPLFIYGGVGLGKTHLMHAIGHEILASNPRAKILYISAETFGNDLIASLQSKKIANFKKRYRSCDVLMVDDIQFISGKEYTQEEFFHTFNELYMSERQIILTSDRPPQEIPKIEERLSSRFLGGLTVDIQPPDYEMRAAILTQKAKEMGITVSSQALSLIAEHSATNARELEGIFRRIVALADSKNQTVNPELVSGFYGVVQEGRRMRLRPNIIIGKVAKYYGFKTQELTNNSRKAPLVAARHVAMFLIKTELDIPHEQIGEIFGGRDHTTIMHAVEKITTEISTNQQVGRAISEIKHELSTSSQGSR
jgi:chromosomal replication initiator protein